MKPTDLSFFDYVKDAFFRRVRLPLLGALPANVMALGVVAVLGIANPGFWLLGAAAEVVYLAGLAGSGRYQRLVQGERLLGVQRQWEVSVQQAVGRLSGAGRKRYHELLGTCRQILGLSDTLDAVSLGNFRDLKARNLNQLLTIFLRLLTSKEVIEGGVANLKPRELEQEIARLERALADAGENEALKRSLQGTLEISKKRLENHERAQASLHVILAELDRIEQQVELLREESAISGRPEMLSSSLDAVTATMTETSRWMDEHSHLLSSLGTEEVAPPLPDLPSLPGMEKEG